MNSQSHRFARFAPLTALVVLGAMVSTVATARAAQPGDRVDLRVLVLSANGAESSFQAWTAALRREGVPFDTLVANTAAPITAATLAASPTHARYQAVVLATGGLLDCTAAGCFSALDAAEWAALDAYQVRFGVRRVTAYAYPTPEYGLNYPFFAGEAGGTTGNVTAEGAATFGSLAGPVPIDGGSWSYFAAPLLDAGVKTLVAGPTAPDGTPSALASVHTRPNGIEELVVTVATNPYQLHAMLLAHGLLEWATGGIHVGHNRNYFILHIDDIFLGDDRWDADANVTHEDDGATIPVVRMLPSDVDRALAWQTSTGLKLDLVFNGAGSDEAIEANGTDPLTTSLLANRASFRWINHTFTHPNLDTMTQAQIVAEIRKNIRWGKDHGIAFHARELVTGEHSGLHNPVMAAALTQARILWTGSDNSREPLPYAVGPAMTVPRHPANVYYNVGTLVEQLDEYNWIYFENCTNTPTHTCRSAMATYQEYVKSEADIMMRHLLTNDPRPHYFHQSNLAEDGTLYPVIGEVLSRYASLLSVPLIQPLFRESSKFLGWQLDWQANLDTGAGTRAEVWLEDGKIRMTSATQVRIPVTGYTAGSLYGGDRSGWILVKAGTTKVVAADPTLTCAHPLTFAKWQTTLATWAALQDAATNPTVAAKYAAKITTLEAKIASLAWTATCP